MANPSPLPLAQKGAPATMRNTEKVNALLTSVNQIRSARVYVAPGPSRVDVSDEGMVITVGGDDILKFLRSGGYIE